MTQTILSNAASGVTAAHTLKRGAAMVWLTAGAATVSHDGEVVHTLVIGERKRFEFGPGQTLLFTATAAGTTAKASAI